MSNLYTKGINICVGCKYERYASCTDDRITECNKQTTNNMKRNKIVFVGDISDMYGNVITLYNEKAKKIIAVQIKETSYISCTPRIGLKVRCEYYTDNKSSSVIIDHLDEVIIGISASNNK